MTLVQAESALKESGYAVRPGVTAKKQALKAINEIVTKLPHLVAKANMRLGRTTREAIFLRGLWGRI